MTIKIIIMRTLFALGVCSVIVTLIGLVMMFIDWRVVRKNEKREKKLGIQEGMIKKGGVNPRPSTPRPLEPPKGQGR